MPLWNLQESIELVQKIEPEVRKVGYYTSLTGGNLHRGYSDKDVDIQIHKLDDNVGYNRDIVAKALESCGLNCVLEYHKMNEYPGRNRKDVEIWSKGERRVDIFYVGLFDNRCFIHDECIQSQLMGELCYARARDAALKNPEFNTWDGTKRVIATETHTKSWNSYRSAIKIDRNDIGY